VRVTGDRVAAVVMGAVTFAALVPVARIDFDRHHDGYMLAQAIAVHGGDAIQRDAFAQYGPVTPWLQSLALFLPIGPALSLRLLNVALISLSVFLMADFGHVAPTSWPWGRWTGFWAAGTWVVLADVWLGVAMLPWSSVLAGTLTIAMLYAAAASVRHAQLGQERPALIGATVAGVCAGLLPFTRLNVGLASLAVMAVVAVSLFRGSTGLRRAVLIRAAVSTLSATAVVISVLVVTRSLGPFVQQSIIWPIAWGQGATDQWKTSENLGRIFGTVAVPVALCLLVFPVRHLVRRLSSAAGRPLMLIAYAYTIAVGLYLVESLAPGSLSSPLGLAGTWRERVALLTSVLSRMSVQYLSFILCLSVTLAFIVALGFVARSASTRTLHRPALAWLALAGLTVAGFTQVVPTWDVRHVWWGAPIGLVLVFSVIERRGRINVPQGNQLMFVVAAATVMAVSCRTAYLAFPRVPGPEGTIIVGMYQPADAAQAIAEDTRLLHDNLVSGQRAVFLVYDGDISVLSGSYDSIDASFVDWGPVPELASRLDENPRIVVPAVSGQPDPLEVARALGYVVAARDARLAVLAPSGQ